MANFELGKRACFVCGSSKFDLWHSIHSNPPTPAMLESLLGMAPKQTLLPRKKKKKAYHVLLCMHCIFNLITGNE